LDEPYVLDQHFHGKPCASHALDEIDPPEIKLVVVPDATLIAMDRWDEPNPLVIAERIR
jgi:hypothetical protein